MHQASGVGPSFCVPKAPQVILLCALGPCLCKNDDVQDQVVSELGLDPDGDESRLEYRNRPNSLRGRTRPAQNSIYIILEVKTNNI